MAQNQQNRQTTGNILIVDAAYLFKGAQKLQNDTGRKIKINKDTMRIIIDHLKHQGNGFDSMHFMTAEKSQGSAWHRQPFYDEMAEVGYEIDIRTFKGKQVYCPKESCIHSKNGFNIQMQAEVDVAIVMKAMEHLYFGRLENLTLLAGDGDFRDMVQFLT